jgi:cell division protein FtsB
MENRQTQDKSKVYLIGIIIILLMMNAFFIYHYVNTDKQLASTTEELAAVESTKLELDQLLKETEAQVDSLRGLNEGLDSLLLERNSEIQEMAAQITSLLRDKRNLAAARQELDKLRYYVEKYQKEIAQLKEKNQQLIQENAQITDRLVKEKTKTEDLTMKTIALENKVNIGSKLKFSTLNISGVNKKGSGRETETSRVRRINLIRVQFTLDLNYVASLGSKTFYLRIIGPEGTTISGESMGGGTFRVGNEDFLYTMSHQIDFDNTGQTVTFYYDKGSEWESGNYKAEIYADGFLIGSQDLKLR